jgi:hypothetical protein
MSYQHIVIPEDSEKIGIQDGQRQIPENPILGPIQ